MKWRNAREELRIMTKGLRIRLWIFDRNCSVQTSNGC